MGNISLMQSYGFVMLDNLTSFSVVISILLGVVIFIMLVIKFAAHCDGKL